MLSLERGEREKDAERESYIKGYVHLLTVFYLNGIFSIVEHHTILLLIFICIATQAGRVSVFVGIAVFTYD